MKTRVLVWKKGEENNAPIGASTWKSEEEVNESMERLANAGVDFLVPKIVDEETYQDMCKKYPHIVKTEENE